VNVCLGECVCVCVCVCDSDQVQQKPSTLIKGGRRGQNRDEERTPLKKEYIEKPRAAQL